MGPANLVVLSCHMARQPGMGLCAQGTERWLFLSLLRHAFDFSRTNHAFLVDLLHPARTVYVRHPSLHALKALLSQHVQGTATF